MTDNVDFMSFDDVGDSRPTIAEDQYVLRIVDPSLKDKKDKSGKYVNYDVIVQEGPEAGYRIFGNMFSLGKRNVWQFKAALKAVGFSIPAGLGVEEAADYFCKNANGFEFVGTVTKKPATARGEDGTYKPVEGQFVNQVSRWLKAVA